MTVVEIPSGTHAAQRCLGGRFRLDERISLDDQVSGFSGPCGSSWEARGLSLWKASDQLLGRPVAIYLLPPGVPVPHTVVEAVQSAARVIDPRLATIYDTDFDPKSAECPYIVSEWAPGTPLEDLVLSGPPPAPPGPGRRHDRRRGGRARGRAPGRPAAPAPYPALAALGRQHRPQDHRTRPRRGAVRPGRRQPSRRQPGSRGHHGAGPDALRPADRVLARRGGHRPAHRAAVGSRHKGRVCTPRQVRAGVPAMLDAITYRGLRGQAADAPLRAQTPAGLAMALRMVQRPSYQLEKPEEEAGPTPPVRANRNASRRHPRHARAAGSGFGHLITLLRPAV